jgi:hypothetical protein
MGADEQALRGELERALEGVDGWLDIHEAWELHEACRVWTAAVAEPCVVEIGAWKGRSCIALARGLVARGSKGVVHSIDPHSNDADAPVPEPETDRLAILLANVERAGLIERVRIHRMMSHEACPDFDPNSVHVLFVDGSHEYEDVVQDIHDWQPKLHSRAVVAFNDPGWTGVNRALREHVVRRRSPFRRPWMNYNTMFFLADPDASWTVADDVRWVRARMLLRAQTGLNRLWTRLQRGAPVWVVAAAEMCSWGLTRALLPPSRRP